jgi:hypothetical protein
MSAGDQCTVGPDGNLLPASSITWFNDPDDEDALPPTSTSTKATSITHHFPFRISNRVPRPSARASDPNNVEALKRKPSRDLDHRTSRSSLSRSSTRTELDADGDELPELEDVSDSEDEGDSDPEKEDEDDEEEEDVEAAYEALKPLRVVTPIAL